MFTASLRRHREARRQSDHVEGRPFPAQSEDERNRCTAGGRNEWASTLFGNIIIATSEIKPIGGEMISLDTTMVLVAGTQSVAAWMIPVIVSAIGIGIVIARKF